MNIGNNQTGKQPRPIQIQPFELTGQPVRGLALLTLCIVAEERAGITYYILALLAWLAIAGLNFIASVLEKATSAKG